MNAADILRYGHGTLHAAIEPLTEAISVAGGVCGWWSCREIMAHLASFEQILIEVLASFTDGAPTPTLERWQQDRQAFNDAEVAARGSLSLAEVVAEYDALHARTMALIADIEPDVLRRPGTIPWYGEEYALDDLIVYQYYGHKREHAAQINQFRDTWKS